MFRKKLLSKAYRFIFALVFAFTMIFGMGCAPASAAGWNIFWYLCGTDLETEGGAATNDLNELLQVQLPEGVNFVIITGGTKTWQNDTVPNDKTMIYVYNSNGLSVFGEYDDSNMGDPDNLRAFLDLAKDNLNEHNGLILWDHGGGSLGGICVDERTNNIMSIDGIRAAFNASFEENTDKPPFDFIGFDACLMSTIDVANAINGMADYMIASEETESSYGWYYTAIADTLAKNPSIDGKELAKIICDSFMAENQKFEVDNFSTLSVIDLHKLPELNKAYENVAKEALENAKENPHYIANFARSVPKMEKYGGNTKSQGYTNMVDLGHMVKLNRELLPNSNVAFLKALEETVVYKVQGEDHKRGMGLSGYYPLSGSQSDAKGFSSLEVANPVFKQYYNLMATPLSDIKSLEEIKLIPKGDTFTANANPRLLDDVSHVQMRVCYFDEADENTLICLGSDNTVEVDWETGEIVDNFQNSWPALNGEFLYVELEEVGEDYNLYASPITLNGEEAYMQISYNYNNGKYKILGVTYEREDGLAEKKIRKLKNGDEVGILLLSTNIEENAEPEFFEAAKVTIQGRPVIEDYDLGDGQYMVSLEFINPQNEDASSEPGFFNVKNGEMVAVSMDQLIEYGDD